MSDGLGQAGSIAFAMRSGPCDWAVGAPKPQLCENAQEGPAGLTPHHCCQYKRKRVWGSSQACGRVSRS